MPIVHSSPLPPHELPTFISRQVRAARYFFLDLDPAPAAALTVVCGGGETCPFGYEINRTSFRYHSIEYVSAGRGRLTMGGRDNVLRPGSVFGYGPATPHRIVTTGEEPLIKYFVNFDGRQAARLLQRAGLVPPRPRVLAQQRWLHDNFNQMLDAGAQPRDVARNQCLLLLQLIVSQLEANLRPLEGEASQAFATFERCRRLIEDRFVELRSVEEIARDGHVDPAYLCRLFRRFANESPYHHLTRLKIAHAATLLLRQHAAVNEVARAVGFDDPYHFSRVFKRVHALSPRKFVAQVGHGRTE